MMDWINHGLAALLTTQWAVPTIIGAMILGMIAILLVNYLRYHSGMKRALQSRLAVLRPIEEAEDSDEARVLFSQSFEDVDRAMRTRDGSVPLVHAWLEFSETFFDRDETVVKTTERPEGYFLHLGDNTRVLAWWANIYVALGLTATFLGIIAALTVTTDGLQKAGADAAGMSAALTSLLHLTAAKFWTSIGGVGVSIVLRLVDRIWHSHSLKRLDRIAYALEKGTVYVPPQQIAADQLRELRQQSTALGEFSTQLAVGIADALQDKLSPVVVGLSGIQSSLDEFKSGSFDQIGKELGTAISQGAGTEMASLAAALTEMTGGIQGVNDRLEGASGQASEQIATAAREFSTASEQMTRAFASLNGNINGMAERLTAEAREAGERNAARVAEDRASYEAMASGQRDVMRAMGEEMRSASTTATGEMVAAVQEAVRSAMTESNAAIRGALEGFAGATAGIQSAFDQMRGQVADLGQALSGSAEGAAQRNAEVLEKAATALEVATGRASKGMGEAIDHAISRSAEEAGRAIAQAFAGFGERFDAASSGLVQTLTTTAGRMEALAQAIERSTGAAGDHAGKLVEAGREAQGVATMLGRAANDVSAAASPIRDAASHIRDSVGQGHEILRRAGEEGTRSAEVIRAASTSLEQTSGSANRAWEGYRSRFEDVDEALARSLDQIKGASAEHATRLNEHVGRIDGALAQAVERLATAIDPLTELSNDLSDVLQRLKDK